MSAQATRAWRAAAPKRWKFFLDRGPRQTVRTMAHRFGKVWGRWVMNSETVSDERGPPKIRSPRRISP